MGEAAEDWTESESESLKKRECRLGNKGFKKAELHTKDHQKVDHLVPARDLDVPNG